MKFVFVYLHKKPSPWYLAHHPFLSLEGKSIYKTKQKHRVLVVCSQDQSNDTFIVELIVLKPHFYI
jgi:hypothetical protein